MDEFYFTEEIKDNNKTEYMGTPIINLGRSLFKIHLP